MSQLQYFTYKGFGDRARKELHMSQSVRIGDIIKISGQCGWDRLTEEIPTDLADQFAPTFENVEHALKQAGGKGWHQVYQVRLFTTQFDDILTKYYLEYMSKYCPNHAPVVTAIGVTELYHGAKLEIEVEAYLGK